MDTRDDQAWTVPWPRSRPTSSPSPGLQTPYALSSLGWILPYLFLQRRRFQAGFMLGRDSEMHGSELTVRSWCFQQGASRARAPRAQGPLMLAPPCPANRCASHCADRGGTGSSAGLEDSPGSCPEHRSRSQSRWTWTTSL